MFTQDKINNFIEESPLLKEVLKLKPLTWINPSKKSMKNMPELPFSMEDMHAVEKLWERFAPYLATVFPETAEDNGAISSPLTEISQMECWLDEHGESFEGNLYLKQDSDLAVAGSIKARGGFYEVLHYAEELALDAGLISELEDYRQFASEKFRKFFQQYTIGVGSTGNLALSIGILSAQLGFNVNVYVSGDAKAWKKELLREKGANVVEFDGDFSEAINAGRKETTENPMGYFVDDENSQQLYLGYSIGALELQRDLENKGIKINKDHPLIVYSPCGVGGSSGGIAFGLKQIYGDSVHSFFVEPTHAPAVLIGLMTGEMSKVSVHDFGIDNITEADGLAVGRSSSFATAISKHIISGVYTIEDYKLYNLLAGLWDSEEIFLEPSATAGLIGPHRVSMTDYAHAQGFEMRNVTHVAWATGGALVPQDARKKFYERGKSALNTVQ